MPARADALPIALKVVVYIALYFATAFVLGPLLAWTGGYFVGITATGLIAAALSNSLSMRIYEQRGVAALGLHSDRASFVNLGLGCLGGIGSAALVLAGPIAFRAAHLDRDPASHTGVPSFLFVSVMLLFGSAGVALTAGL